MSVMNKILVLVCFLSLGVMQAQEVESQYEKDGDIIKVTHFYDNGNVKEQGFYKDKLLDGKWVRFDESGKKTVEAYYSKGRKVGKWFVWTKNEVKEVSYENNAVANVQTKNENTQLAVK